MMTVSWAIAAPGGIPVWEETIFRALNELPNWLFPVLWGPMQFGAVLGAGVVAAALFVARRPASAVAYASASLLGWVLAIGVKNIVERGRPIGAGLDEVIVHGADPSGFGFISGHTTVAFAGATVVWVFFGRRWGTIAYVLALVVGVSRMYVGAHLPLDVAGGAAAGTIVGGLVTYGELILARASARRVRRQTAAR